MKSLTAAIFKFLSFYSPIGHSRDIGESNFTRNTLIKRHAIRTLFLLILILSAQSIISSPAIASANYFSNCKNILDMVLGLKKEVKYGKFEGLYRTVLLDRPMNISTYQRVVGRKIIYDKNQKFIGHSYIIEINDKHAKGFFDQKEALGLLAHRTEMEAHNQKLYNSLGLIETQHPYYGKYYSEIPSPELFEHLRYLYNSAVDDSRKVHMGLYQSEVTSAHQTEMVTHWTGNQVVAIGRPEFGSISGLKPDELTNAFNPAKELNSIFRHDIEHFGSIFYIPKVVIDFNKKLGEFWNLVLKQARTEGLKKSNPKGHRKMLDYVYTYNRRFHSLTHVLGMLLRGKGSINIHKHDLKDFGQVARVETPTVHWVGLGFKPEWVTSEDLPFASNLLEIGLRQAQVPTHDVSIADAFHSVTNLDLEDIEKFMNDPEMMAIFGGKAEFENMLKEIGLSLNDGMSAAQLEQLQAHTLDRYRNM